MERQERFADLAFCPGIQHSHTPLANRRRNTHTDLQWGTLHSLMLLLNLGEHICGPTPQTQNTFQRSIEYNLNNRNSLLLETKQRNKLCVVQGKRIMSSPLSRINPMSTSHLSLLLCAGGSTSSMALCSPAIPPTSPSALSSSALPPTSSGTLSSSALPPTSSGTLSSPAPTSSASWWSSTSSSTNGGQNGTFKPAWGPDGKRFPKLTTPKNNGASGEHHNPPRAEPRTHNPSCHNGDVKPQAALWGGGGRLVMHPNHPKHFSDKNKRRPHNKNHLLRDRKAWKAPKISCWKQLGKIKNWVWAAEGFHFPTPENLVFDVFFFLSYIPIRAMHPEGSGLFQPGTTPFLLIFPTLPPKETEMCVCVCEESKKGKRNKRM